MPHSSKTSRWHMYRIAVTLLLILAGSCFLRAQEMESPMSTQLPLLMKILSFDRNLSTRGKGEISIGVVYQSGFKTSLNAKEEFLDVMNAYHLKNVEGIPIRCIPIDIDGDGSLKNVVSTNKINTLYLTPLRGIMLESISGFAGVGQLLTLTGVPEYVGSGVAVGIGTKGEKPVIIINLPVAKAAGVDFNSQLLRLARVIQ